MTVTNTTYVTNSDTYTLTSSDTDINMGGGNNFVTIPYDATQMLGITTGSGSDTIDGRTLNTLAYMNLGDGNDFAIGRPPSYSYMPSGTAVIYGEGGNDTIGGGHGNDYLYGGAGNDNLWGSLGNDFLNGGDGNDELYADAGNCVLVGGYGSDTINGASGNDFIYGDEERVDVSPSYATAGNHADWLWGGDGSDSIVGGDGNDSLGGGTGADWLMGGIGNDSLWGGNGASDGEMDVFIYSYGDGVDYIMDFEGGIDGLWVLNASFTKAEAHGNDVWAYVGDNGGFIIKDAVGKDIKYYDASCTEIKTARIDK